MTDDAGRPSPSAPHTAFGWLAFTCTVGVIVTSQAVARGNVAVLRGMGVALLVLAPVFFVPPFLLLSRHGGRPTGSPYYATTRLVGRGPYAVVRHPQYLGYAMLAAGFALLSQRVLTGGLAVAAIACFVLHSRREEAHCLRVFGDDYRRYMQRVPAFNVLRGLWRRVRHARS